MGPGKRNGVGLEGGGGGERPAHAVWGLTLISVKSCRLPC